ncbi:MAG TPA: Hsp70 family protein, partial [Acidimicrobiales bacterium]|nr:Hsp70 family protein [Acidimicrobiales bacterium]
MKCSISFCCATGAPPGTISTCSRGGRTTPSVVGFSKTGEVLVGEVAKRQAI